MGYVRNPWPDGPTMTDLGVLRARGTDDPAPTIAQPSGGPLEDETLGQFAVLSRMRQRARVDPRRMLALTTRRGPGGRLMKRQTTARQAATIRRITGTPTTTRRRGGIGGFARRLAERARERARTAAAQQRALADRQRAAAAERAASEAAQIAEAERLAREAVITPPTVTDRNGQRWRRSDPRTPLTIHPGPACPTARPAPRAGGVWQCIRGNWSFQQLSTTMPVPRVTNGATPPAWWLARPREGDADSPAQRNGGAVQLPGAGWRIPESPRDTATERVPEDAPAGGLDMQKMLPLAAGLAALMFMGG